MKRSKAELDVDFIGGMGPMTKEEEKLVSDFIKASKAKSKSKANKPLSKLKHTRILS